MRKWILSLLIITLTTSQVFAQSTILEKGDTAPYKGLLLTPERAEKAAKAEKRVIVLEDLRIAQNELIEFHKDQVKVTRRKLSEAKWDGFWSNTGYFLLGCVLTSVAFKMNKEVMR